MLRVPFLVSYFCREVSTVRIGGIRLHYPVVCGTIAVAGAVVVGVVVGLAAAHDPIPRTDPPPSASPIADERAAKDVKEDSETVQPKRVTLDVARDRAELMHDIYSATLEAMHHRYFHGDRAFVPARAMEDVFREIQHVRQVQTKWISASFSPMSIDHEPASDFEKQASKRISRGETAIETIEGGYYRRAGSILLDTECISCHAGFFANTAPTRKFAGLIISIPVDNQARLTNDDVKPASQRQP